jgi:hypothetical protein
MELPIILPQICLKTIDVFVSGSGLDRVSLAGGSRFVRGIIFVHLLHGLVCEILSTWIVFHETSIRASKLVVSPQESSITGAECQYQCVKVGSGGYLKHTRFPP